MFVRFSIPRISLISYSIVIIKQTLLLVVTDHIKVCRAFNIEYHYLKYENEKSGDSIQNLDILNCDFVWKLGTLLENVMLPHAHYPRKWEVQQLCEKFRHREFAICVNTGLITWTSILLISFSYCHSVWLSLIDLFCHGSIICLLLLFRKFHLYYMHITYSFPVPVIIVCIFVTLSCGKYDRN